MRSLTIKYSTRLSIAITGYCEGYRHARDNANHFENIPAEEIKKLAGEFLRAIKKQYGRITPRALGIAAFYLDLAKKKRAVA